LNSNSKQKIRRSFDKASLLYDRYAYFQSEIGKVVTQRVITECRGGGIALDIGCGTGEITMELVKLKIFNKVIACDISEGMLELTSRRHGGSSNLLPILADVEDLPIQSGSIDLVVSSMALQWVDDLYVALQAIGQILKRDGRFVCATLGHGTFIELKEAFSAAWPEGKTKLDNVFYEFVELEELKKIVEACGMSGTVKCKAYKKKYTSFRHFLKTLKQVGAQNSNGFSSFGLGRREIMFRMEEEYHRRFSLEGGVIATYQVLYIDAERQ